MSQSNSPIRAILCDFGGVIYRTPSKEQFKRWLRLFGIRDMGPLEMLSASPLESPYVMDLWTGKTPEKQIWDELERTWRIHPSLLRWMRRRGYATRYLDKSLIAFLQTLRPHYRTAILTNAGTDFRSTFTTVFALETFVDQVIISAEEGMAKPDPAIFLHAAQRLGVGPSEAVFVDDMPENVEGARSVGMHAFLYESREQVIREIQSQIG